MNHQSNRARTVKLLVDNGEIQSFWQIYETIPKSNVAKALGIHFSRMQTMIRYVNRIRVQDIFLLSRYFDMDSDTMWQLIKNQYVTGSKPPLKEKNSRKVSGLRSHRPLRKAKRHKG
jgi:hypothetical protein